MRERVIAMKELRFVSLQFGSFSSDIFSLMFQHFKMISSIKVEIYFEKTKIRYNREKFASGSTRDSEKSLRLLRELGEMYLKQGGGRIR